MHLLTWCIVGIRLACSQQQQLLLLDWYWDEVAYEYDDDAFEAEYWDYDWDSVWGEYA